MSQLKQHLQAEKERHQCVVYPGNLAQEMLGATKANQASLMDYADASLRNRPSRLKWLIGLAGLSAMAAALLLVVWSNHNATTTPFAKNDESINEPMNDTINETAEEPDAPIALSTTESMPDDVPVMLSSAGSITPEYESMNFSAIPSFSDLSNTDDTTN